MLVSAGVVALVSGVGTGWLLPIAGELVGGTGGG